MKKITISFGRSNINVRPLPYTTTSRLHSDCEPDPIIGGLEHKDNTTTSIHLSRKNINLRYIIRYISDGTNVIIQCFSCMSKELE